MTDQRLEGEEVRVYTYCIEEPSLLARWECGRLAAIEAAEEVERTAKWLGGKLPPVVLVFSAT